MKAIFASKLYQASSRKEAIQAALNNPINSELVQQLRTYLDPEYQSTVDSKSDKEGDNESSKVDGVPKSDNSTTPSAASSPASFSTNSMSSGEDGDLEGQLNIEDDTPVEDDIAEDRPVAESTSINGNPITSSVILPGEVDVDVIKGTLNSRQDTAGVNRILVKESEMWIYYEDKINLNNVMSYVIEFLNSAGYSCLEFNRLARTDNAIVFQMYELSTSNIKPLGDAENGKE